MSCWARANGGGADRGSCLAGQRVVDRHTCKPYLVVRRRSQPSLIQSNLSTALHRLHDPASVDFTLQSESTYDWETREWLAPLNFMVAKIVRNRPAEGQHHRRGALLGPIFPMPVHMDLAAGSG